MAKTVSPLFAVEASGQVGRAIVYDRRGYVRVYSKPSNPKTDAQGDLRTAFRAVAAVVGVVGPNAKNDIKGQAPTSYRWNAFLVKRILGPGLSQWEASRTAYENLDETDRGNWNTTAQNAYINPAPVDYDNDPPANLPGLALYAAARALHKMGLGPGDPDQTATPTDWANYITQ